MAASLGRFSWTHARVTIETTYPEWEGEVETETHEDVRAVCTELRREGGWFLRLFEPATGRLLQKMPVGSSVPDRGIALLAAGLPGGGALRVRVEREGGCNCG
jgi:hypothetical protein